MDRKIIYFHGESKHKWEDAVLLDKVYEAIFETLILFPECHNLLRRVLFEKAAFREVFIGNIVYPLYEYFCRLLPTADVNTIIVRPIVYYFTVFEGKDYDVLALYRMVLTNLSTRFPIVDTVTQSALFSVLTQYAPSSNHRYLKGKVICTFFPKKTISKRDLENDYYIRQLRHVQLSFVSRLSPITPTASTTPGASSALIVVPTASSPTAAAVATVATSGHTKKPVSTLQRTVNSSCETFDQQECVNHLFDCLGI